tara:strand:+ start:2210 stop:2701 length:492 start_codon:yes stop_codon:yes gene_type:complete
MKLSTLIKQLGLTNKLDTEDVKIINSLIKDKYSESKKYKKKVLIDSVALIYYAIKYDDKNVIYISSHIDDAYSVRDSIVTLIKESKIPKKTKIITKKIASKISFFSGVNIQFLPFKQSYPGVQIHWLLVNDIKMIEPPKYVKLFNNHYPPINATKSAQLTLSP